MIPGRERLLMRNIKLVLEYDGSKYHGWQFQANANSVQQELATAIKKLTGESVIPDGAGRTDAGVHALGQVASFKTESSIPAEKFAPALNSILPPGICVLRSEQADPDFHPRFSAKGKHYCYLVLNRAQRSPLWETRAWHVRDRLDFEAMEKAARYFMGTHNFRAFCASGHQNKTFTRTIAHSSWQFGNEVLRYDTIGDAFLYNMVRIMTGTMIDIGRGRFPPEVILEAFETGERNTLGMTAPPEGLYLVEVFY